MKYIKYNKQKTLFSPRFLIFILILTAISLFIVSFIGGKGIISSSLFEDARGMFFLFIIPFAFLCFGGIYLFLLINDSFKKQKITKAGLKFFFLVLILVVAGTLPVTLIVGNFVNSSINSWFSHSISSSLSSSVEMSKNYIEARRTSMEKISSTYFNGLAIGNFKIRQIDWMRDIRTIDPMVASCQVYSIEKNDEKKIAKNIVETGDSNKFLSSDFFLSVDDSFFIEDKSDNTLKMGKIVKYAGNEYVCVLNALLPDNFIVNKEAIIEAKNQALAIDVLKPHLPFLNIWIFVLFVLPIFLLGTGLIWILSFDFFSPFNFCIEASKENKSSREDELIITHLNEMSGIVEILNQSLKSKDGEN